MIRLKRAYEPPSREDGLRILVDRIWPRGVTRDTLRLSAWMKEIAPSPGLRRWFGHDPRRWDAFRRRYTKELAAPEKEALVRDLARLARDGTVTLVFGAKDPERNNAVVLKDFLERGGRLPGRPGPRAGRQASPAGRHGPVREVSSPPKRPFRDNSLNNNE